VRLYVPRVQEDQHLASDHNIHQQVVVAKGLLEEQVGTCYKEDLVIGKQEPLQCPFPGCPGVLSSPYML